MKIKRVFTTIQYEVEGEVKTLRADNPDIDSAIASLGAIERKLEREKDLITSDI